MRIGNITALWTALAFLTVVSAWAQGWPRDPASLERRADSLAALDPAKEVEKAIDRGDLRFIAVCGYACFPPGVDPDDSIVIRGMQTTWWDSGASSAPA